MCTCTSYFPCVPTVPFNTTVAIHTITFSNFSGVVHSFKYVQCFHNSHSFYFFIIVICAYASYLPGVPTVPFNTTVAIHTIVFFNLFHIFYIPPCFLELFIVFHMFYVFHNSQSFHSFPNCHIFIFFIIYICSHGALQHDCSYTRDCIFQFVQSILHFTFFWSCS